MDIQREREAFECEFKQTDYYIAHGDLSTLMLCDDQYALDDVQVSFEMWQAAKAQAVPYESCSIKSHEIIINETKNELIGSYDIAKEDEYLLESLVYRGVCIGKAQAVPESIITELQIDWGMECPKCNHNEATCYSTAAQESGYEFMNGDAVSCNKCGNIGEMDAQGEDSDILWNEDEETAKNA